MCMGGGGATQYAHNQMGLGEEYEAQQAAAAEADRAKRAAQFEAQRQAAMGQRAAIVASAAPGTKQLLGQ